MLQKKNSKGKGAVQLGIDTCWLVATLVASPFMLIKAGAEGAAALAGFDTGGQNDPFYLNRMVSEKVDYANRELDDIKYGGNKLASKSKKSANKSKVSK